MKRSTLLLLLCIIAEGLLGQTKQYPAPSASFTANYCGFPLAWESSKAKAAPITVVTDKLDQADSVMLQQLVPDASIRTVAYTDFINQKIKKNSQAGVMVILTEPQQASYPMLLKAIKHHIQQGNAVVLPAVFREMNTEHCSDKWQQLLKQASSAGAVVVGAHGSSLVIGDIAFIRPLPIDVFALVELDDEGYPNAKIRLKGQLESAAIPVAAGIAIKKGMAPKLSSQEMKNELRKYSSTAIWGDIESREGNEVSHFSIIKPNSQSFDKEAAEQASYGAKLAERYEGRYFDAGLFVTHHTFSSKEWSHGVLKLDALQRLGTGKGIKVAILDHFFASDDSTITRHYVTPGSAYPKVCYNDGGEGHGAWMAGHLLDIAPEVSIIPVRITDEKYRVSCAGFVKGIDYAISQGADIISLSHQPVKRSERAILDSAIARASAKNICFVYVHYDGDRNDVVRTSPIEFVEQPNSTATINIIGTGFKNENSFPFTWGFSQTAPIVSGVIALMKEKNPQLTTSEIVSILSDSYNENQKGFRYLDAEKALRKAMTK